VIRTLISKQGGHLKHCSEVSRLAEERLSGTPCRNGEDLAFASWG